jgi:YaiO family outer membrane protein
MKYFYCVVWVPIFFGAALVSKANSPFHYRDFANLTDSSWSASDSVEVAASAPEFLNSLEFTSRYERYLDGYNDRTFNFLQYGHTFGRVDAFAKVLYYTLGDLNGVQLETEAYWRFKKNGYAYFDVAYSDAIILPNYRLRAELFRNAGRFEYSLGAGVVKPFNFREIPVITGTLGYYFGDYYVYVRPTATYVDNGWTQSWFVQARKYFTKTDFIAISALKGNDTGTSRAENAIANEFGNDTYLVRMNGMMKRSKYKFGAGLDFGGIFIPQRDEYARFVGFDVSIIRLF